MHIHEQIEKWNLAIGLSSHSESQMASDEVLIITASNCYNTNNNTRSQKNSVMN